MSLNKTTIRIRSNPRHVQKQIQRRRKTSLHQIQQMNQTKPTFLSEVKNIMNEAKQTSNTINIQFRKICDKPSVQVLYLPPQRLQKKLHQISSRIQSGKYYVLVQIRKDAVNGYATKKQIVTDDIIKKNYKTIYKQYFQDQRCQTAVEILNNPLVNLYQFYDDQQRIWKQSLKSRHLIGRSPQIYTARQKQHCQNLQSSRINESSSRYQQMFEEIALENGFFEPVKANIPKAQNIVIDRFQNKFYKCREKRYEHVFDRLIKDQTNEQLTKQNQQISPKKNKIKLVVPKSCQKVYKTQNKLLQQNMNKGLSNMNKKKLIAEFNKTILDMKGNISSENSKKIQYKQQNKQNRFNNF